MRTVNSEDSFVFYFDGCLRRRRTVNPLRNFLPSQVQLILPLVLEPAASSSFFILAASCRGLVASRWLRLNFKVSQLDHSPAPIALASSPTFLRFFALLSHPTSARFPLVKPSRSLVFASFRFFPYLRSLDGTPQYQLTIRLRYSTFGCNDA